MMEKKQGCRLRTFALAVLLLATVLAACSRGAGQQATPGGHEATVPPVLAGGGTVAVHLGVPGTAPLPAPQELQPFPGTPARPGQGTWRPVGRPVAGQPAVYRTVLVPPGGTKAAGIAWMDTDLLSARLYSGSLSPGGGPYKYTAPVSAVAASSLVAAFNGGFKMKDAHGGYYTENRTVRPLRRGAASLVIYASGAATVGTWGSDLTMTPSVAAVRQNLFPLVVNGKPSALASTRTWRVWGGTCPCGAGLHGTAQQWRSGLGVTANGALVYVVGPQLDPLQVADLLIRAGAVRGMQLDINPTWPVFASFKPVTAGGLAAPANGTSLVGTYLGPPTFFKSSYDRDFITMSARPA